jgi:hypothetical protein
MRRSNPSSEMRDCQDLLCRPRNDNLLNDDTGAGERVYDSSFWTWRAPVCIIEAAQIMQGIDYGYGNGSS